MMMRNTILILPRCGVDCSGAYCLLILWTLTHVKVAALPLRVPRRKIPLLTKNSSDVFQLQQSQVATLIEKSTPALKSNSTCIATILR